MVKKKATNVCIVGKKKLVMFLAGHVLIKTPLFEDQNNNVIFNFFFLPLSQLSPVYPLLHSQYGFPSPESLHLPCLHLTDWQGLNSISSSSQRTPPCPCRHLQLYENALIGKQVPCTHLQGKQAQENKNKLFIKVQAKQH